MGKDNPRKALFTERVRAVVRGIPRGRVMTYGVVAEVAGYVGAARAVGTLLRKNRDVGVPCHRVVRSDGTVGEYNRGGAAAKERRLRREGVCFSGRRVVESSKK